MKTLVALAVVLLVSTQLCAEEIGASDDLNYWSDWSDSDQIKVSPGPKLAHVLFPGLGTCHFPPPLVSLVGTTTATTGSGGTLGGEDVKEATPWDPHEILCPPSKFLPEGCGSGLRNSLKQ